MRIGAFFLTALFGLVIASSAHAQGYYHNQDYRPHYGQGYDTSNCGNSPCIVNGIPPMPVQRIPGPPPPYRYYESGQPRTTMAHCTMGAAVRGECHRKVIAPAQPPPPVQYEPELGVAEQSAAVITPAGPIDKTCGRGDDEWWVREKGKAVVQETSMPLPTRPKPYPGARWAAKFNKATGSWEDCGYYAVKSTNWAYGHGRFRPYLSYGDGYYGNGY